MTDYLSGDAGDVTGWRRAKRTVADVAFEAIDQALGIGRRADALAAAAPARQVLVAGVYRPGSALEPEPLRSVRHSVDFALGPAGELGKFQNLNAVWEAQPPGPFDWLIVLDDDVTLPHRFLDRFVAICERFDLALAQPAQPLMSQRTSS